MLRMNIWEILMLAVNVEMENVRSECFDKCNVRSECGNGGMLGVNVLIGTMLGVNVEMEEC